VRILLERNDINLNIADTRYGQTPLEYAVSKGYQEIAELLQERANSITSNMLLITGALLTRSLQS